MTDQWCRFEVFKDDFTKTRWVEGALPPLEDGEVRLALSTASFTSNNITYGIVGEQYGYWRFFPVEEDGWGCLPVWGFADVVESRAEGLEVGERIYGYFPMGSHLTVTPVKVAPHKFTDGAAHRQGLPGPYNYYERLAVDPNYAREMEPHHSLFAPLASTAYGLAEWVSRSDYQGADVIVCLSASSKTSLSTAIYLKSMGVTGKLVGMTSERNKSVVEKIGVYDEVITYDDYTSLEKGRGHLILDFAGNGVVTANVHQHLGDDMLHHTVVGASHAQAQRRIDGVIAERSEVFFLPTYMDQRLKETDGKFITDMRSAMVDVTKQAAGWMELDRAADRGAIEKLYNTVREGRIAPDHGGILQFDHICE
ncbi:DUF2855 family protein [Parvularcula marina]|uniref:DUF2855 family protein n=1 Tax=Parvularcula marina TaxID=2292771 RepID=UPI0035115313